MVGILLASLLTPPKSGKRQPQTASSSGSFSLRPGRKKPPCPGSKAPGQRAPRAGGIRKKDGLRVSFQLELPLFGRLLKGKPSMLCWERPFGWFAEGENHKKNQPLLLEKAKWGRRRLDPPFGVCLFYPCLVAV